MKQNRLRHLQWILLNYLSLIIHDDWALSLNNMLFMHYLLFVLLLLLYLINTWAKIFNSLLAEANMVSGWIIATLRYYISWRIFICWTQIVALIPAEINHRDYLREGYGLLALRLLEVIDDALKASDYPILILYSFFTHVEEMIQLIFFFLNLLNFFD